MIGRRRETNSVIAVIPASAVHEQAHVYRSRRGEPAVFADPKDARLQKAAASGVAETYALIESRRADGGVGADRWWIGRTWVVVQWTMDVPDARGRVLLARFRKGWLREPLETSGLIQAIVGCAQAARLPLDQADVRRVLAAAKEKTK